MHRAAPKSDIDESALTVTAPETARGIAEHRRAQHREQGGGAIVTTCGSSRKLLARDGTRVFDLATLIARATAG